MIIHVSSGNVARLTIQNAGKRAAIDVEWRCEPTPKASALTRSYPVVLG
jgi:hypothetical protein